MLSSDLSPAAPQRRMEPPTDKIRVASTRRRVPTNLVSSRTLQPSIESVVANSFVPSDFLVDGQVIGLGTVHHHLTLNFFSTWILPLHIESCCLSTLKRKSSSSVMDGLQGRQPFDSTFLHIFQASCYLLYRIFKCYSVSSFLFHMIEFFYA